MGAKVEITQANFDAEVSGSDLPVLVDFWAEWCMPCKMIAPFVEEIAEKYAGKLKVGSVDIDKESDLATRYGIVSIPTLIVFKGGAVVRQKVGALPRHELENLVKDFI
jgi:thioredoxin 1